MLQDRFRKKSKQPPSGNGSSLETTDITDQVPKIDDVLDEVDKAIKKAEQLQARVQPRGCGCR